MTSKDIFDILDVSLREDTYTRLFYEILLAHEPVRAALFRSLTGQTATGWGGPAALRFRGATEIGMGEDDSKPDRAETRNIPDLVVKGVVAGDKRWDLVLEFKVKAGEGSRQCKRYEDDYIAMPREGTVEDYTLVFVALDGRPPRHERGVSAGHRWKALSHDGLSELVVQADSQGILEEGSALASAWQAYRQRLCHFREYPAALASEALARWLDPSREPEYFVTLANRCDRVAHALVGGDWEKGGGLVTAQGRRNCLVQAWQKGWRLQPRPTAPGAEPPLGISVHYELTLPLVVRRPETATCHIHCETAPYITGAKLEDEGERAEPFIVFKEALREQLHARIAAQEVWKRRNSLWEVGATQLSLYPEMTIGELATDLRRVLDEGRTAIDESVVVAARACHLTAE